MKRYLLFAGIKGHSKGGFYDMKAQFDSEELASEAFLEAVNVCTWDWVHVVDTHENRIIWRTEDDEYGNE